MWMTPMVSLTILFTQDLNEEEGKKDDREKIGEQLEILIT